MCVRSVVESMSGYVPGEQPKDLDLIKLNTNENPYPPSSRVVEALRESIGERLKLYPDPVCSGIKEKAARLYEVNPDQILVGNGSDDILSIITRTVAGKGDVVAITEPTYSLYEVLAELQEAELDVYPLDKGIGIPEAMYSTKAKLVFLSCPNAPTGVVFPKEDIQKLAESINGILLIDEAYVDFAQTDCLDIFRQNSNVVLSRTLSKSFSLAGIRLGFAIGSSDIIRQMSKVKDSYNVNFLTAVAGEAALDDVDYIKKNARIICRDRALLEEGLKNLSIETFPSQANFVMARFSKGLSAKKVFDKLREKGILVRYFNLDCLGECLRITVGTHQQVVYFLDALEKILSGGDL